MNVLGADGEAGPIAGWLGGGPEIVRTPGRLDYCTPSLRTKALRVACGPRPKGDTV